MPPPRIIYNSFRRSSLFRRTDAVVWAFRILIVTFFFLLVGRRVGADGRVLAMGELGVGLEGLLGLVCDACVSRHCFIERFE